MAIKGGYQIVDFGDVNFTPGAGTTIPGIGEYFKYSYRKPYLVSGLTISAEKMPMAWVSFRSADGVLFEGTVYGYPISVNVNTNAVTVSAPPAV